MIKSIHPYNGLNVTLQVTEDCNLRCVYCYEVNKKPGTLKLEYAKKFIDIILEDPDPIGVIGTESEWILNQGLIVDFIGGDALMVPELCDKILQYLQFRMYELNHRWKNRWRCSISTNGTLFSNPGVKEFLNKYKDNISLGISVDGCPEIHDRNRIHRDGTGSMVDILKDWEFYLQYMGEYASTKSTLNRDSIPFIYESIKYLHETLGLKHINMNFIFEDMGLVDNDYIEIDKQLELSIQYILEHSNDLYVNMFSEGFGPGEPMDDNTRNKGWCGAGAMPCLSLNGKIYPCFRFVPNTMHSPSLDFHVGDIWNGFNRKDRFQVVRDQTRDKISPDKCKECSIESSCAWCIGGAYSESGVFYRTTSLCRIKELIDKYSKIYWKEYYGK